MTFAKDMKKEIDEKVVNPFVEFRGGVLAGDFLDVARGSAPVKTGNLQQGIVAFSGSPPRQLTKQSTPTAQAMSESKRSGIKGAFGFASTAEYSSYVNKRRPFIDLAISAANSSKPRD